VLLQIERGVGELGEDQHLVGRVLAREQIAKQAEFGISRGVPSACALQHTKQALGVGEQVPGQCRGEKVGVKPLEALLELLPIGLVHPRSTQPIGLQVNWMAVWHLTLGH